MRARHASLPPAKTTPSRAVPPRAPAQSPITMATSGASWSKRRCSWSGGRAGCRQRPRGRAPRRGVAGGAVPAFSEPRCADERGGRGGAARFRAEIDGALAEAPAGDPLAAVPLRWGSPICAGRCATPPISRSSPAAAFSITTAPSCIARQCRADRPDREHAGGGVCGGPIASDGPETGPDRRPRAGLWLCPDEHRRSFSALGRRRGRGRADRGSDPRPLHRGYRAARWHTAQRRKFTAPNVLTGKFIACS